MLSFVRESRRHVPFLVSLTVHVQSHVLHLHQHEVVVGQRHSRLVPPLLSRAWELATVVLQVLVAPFVHFGQLRVVRLASQELLGVQLSAVVNEVLLIVLL